jgi:prophage antirepressor-like protein
MSSLINFDFKGNSVRVFYIDDDVWFTAKDIAHNLDYADTRRMTDLVDDEDKMTINPQKMGSASHAESFGDNTFKVSVVNESGLYACIFGSKKPKAKEFKRWVTSEVLPQIRKTGQYSKLSPAEILLKQAEQLLELEKKQGELKEFVGLNQQSIQQLEQQNEELENQIIQETERRNELTEAVNNHDAELTRINRPYGYYYTVMGFANIQNIKITYTEAQKYGRLASRLSDEQQIPKDKVRDQRFGEVGCYSEFILNEIFKLD